MSLAPLKSGQRLDSLVDDDDVDVVACNAGPHLCEWSEKECSSTRCSLRFSVLPLHASELCDQGLARNGEGR